MSPLLLLKFIPVKFLKKYWKPIIGGIALLAYTAAVNSCAVDRTNAKWEVREAERVQAESEAETKARQEAAKIKLKQDSANAAAQEKLKKEADEAKQRAADARKDAAEQRRLNNASTKELERLQAESPIAPQPIPDSGVRDTLSSLQDEVRSRRQP